MKVASLLIASALCCSTAIAAPLTITWGAQNAGGALGTAGGQELAAGSLVRLGVFDMPAEQVADLAWNPSALDAHFTELARATIGDFGGESFPVSGAFAAVSPLESTELPLKLSEQPLCIWATNSSDLNSASEIGIFSDPSWTLSLGQFGALSWDLSQVNATDVWVGSLGGVSPTLSGPIHFLEKLQTLKDKTDLDADGAVRLLEEAFGMNPDTADSQLLPALQMLGQSGDTRPTLLFRRHGEGTVINPAIYESEGFRYIVETSSDLQHWEVDPTSCTQNSVSPLSGGLELVTLCVATENAGSQRFFRVRVERL